MPQFGPPLLPIFFTIEATRAALWAVRTIEEPDRDGPLLRALFALLVGVLAVVPSPVWTLVTYIMWLAWIPVRGILWVWGIGRETVKKRACLSRAPCVSAARVRSWHLLTPFTRFSECCDALVRVYTGAACKATTRTTV